MEKEIKEISVVIPVYNEELNLNTLYERIQNVFLKLNIDHEFIFVNDGSKDRSIEIIKSFAAKDKNVKYISFSRNFGHQIAVTAGLDKSTGKAVVIIDADLQDPPELIGEMYKKYKEGFQNVYARRKTRKGEGPLKKITAKLFYRLLSRLTHISIPVDTGDFRIIDRKIVDGLKQMPEQHKFLRGQISWIGFSQTFVEYDRDERQGGKTGYTYRKMIRFALDGITSFSNTPLRFATTAGFVTFIISFILICYALYSKFFLNETTIRGWTSLMVSVLFIGSIQLLSIGIIGEYVSRLSDNVRNRPKYIVEESNISDEE